MYEKNINLCSTRQNKKEHKECGLNHILRILFLNMHIILWNKKNQLQKEKEKGKKRKRHATKTIDHIRSISKNLRKKKQLDNAQCCLSHSHSQSLVFIFSKISFSLFGEPLLFWFGFVYSGFTHACTHACNPILMAFGVWLNLSQSRLLLFFFCILSEWLFCFWLCDGHDSLSRFGVYLCWFFCGS